MAAGHGGFVPVWMNRRALDCWRSADHTRAALDVDAIPGVRRSPLLDKRGAMNHDLSASDIGRRHRIEIAPNRLGTDSTDLRVAER